MAFDGIELWNKNGNNNSIQIYEVVNVVLLVLVDHCRVFIFRLIYYHWRCRPLRCWCCTKTSKEYKRVSVCVLCAEVKVRTTFAEMLCMLLDTCIEIYAYGLWVMHVSRDFIKSV